MLTTKLDFKKDTVIFADDEYYTTTGALKVMGIGMTTLSKEIKNNNIEPLIHPGGNLYSKGSILGWLERRSKRNRKQKQTRSFMPRNARKTRNI